MSNDLMRTTVILPIYNEAEIIGKVFREVRRFALNNPGFNFVFVDDGSNDGTPRILDESIRRAGREQFRLLSYGPNRGKGFAVRKGVEQSNTDFVCFMDGDLAYSLDHLPRLVEALGSHDVIIGSRNLAGEKQRNIQLARRIMGWGFNLLARTLLRLPYRDTQAGLKGFRLEAAKRIFVRQRIFGFCFDAELLFVARRLGCRIAEVPARVSEAHVYRGSQVDLRRDPPRMLVSLFQICWNSAQGKYD